MKKRHGLAKKTDICIPLTDNNKEALIESAKIAMNQYQDCFDYIEWRLDRYASWKQEDIVLDTVQTLSDIIEDKGLIVTIRTQEEGGEATCTFSEYESLLMQLALLPHVHYLDVQVFFGQKEQMQQLIHSIHKAGTKVIGSYHDFQKTPEDDEIRKRFVAMEEIEVDVAKMAVMPHSEKDVLRFMATVQAINEDLVHIPMITMSMGNMGVISRLSGKLTGSVLSFASLNEVSAPGQIHVEQMASMMDVLEG